MTPEQVRFIEWARAQPGDVAFRMNAICNYCSRTKPVVILTSWKLWACGECWNQYVSNDGDAALR